MRYAGALCGRLALVALLFGLLPGAALAQSMTVEEIIGLIKAGVSEDVILFKVRQAPEGLDLSGEDMVRLREAGATDRFLLDVLKATGETAIGPDEPVQIEAAAPNAATLLLSTVPSGARVVLDGVPVGTTPYVGNQLEAGQHELYITRKYYRPVVKTILAKAGQKIELEEPLELELPGVSLALKTKGLPKGNRWTVRGLDSCSSTPYLPVAREGKDEERVVLLRKPGVDSRSGNTCLEVYFWVEARDPDPGGEAPPADVVFRIESVPLNAIEMTELDLLVERDAESNTGLRCQIVRGPGRLSRATGSAG